MKSRFARRLILFIFTVVLLPRSIAFGRILDKWDHPDAYKPSPILFLHGFAAGQASSWDKIVSDLDKYFDDYTKVSIYQDLSKPYLERLAFNDPNGSIDTYPPGKLNPDGNSDGWADKISNRIEVLMSKYRFKDIALKFNVICHSMGGLAAREYVTNPKYGNSYLNIDKIITIGTPHAGSPLGNVKIKIEKAINEVSKYIWEVPYYERTLVIAEAYESNYTIKYVRGKYKIDFNGEAIKDMAVGSQFLMNLKGRSFPSNIKKFAIFGEANTWIFKQLNAMFFYLYYPNERYTCGDGIVPRDSQKGYDFMTEYPSKEYWVWKPEKIERILANHIKELESEKVIPQLLSFLDSTKPELEIAEPNPNMTTEIHESSIHIKGIAYKEYLPADTKLTIVVRRQEDNNQFSLPESYLKPSSLWLPDNPDSPVAEFDEVVVFPGQGTYRVSLQAKNPAGLPSEIKELWVKVTGLNAKIIVHCHNPEGKEIASIKGMDSESVQIYDGNILIGYGAYNSETHNKPIEVSAGTQARTIRAVFNGMTKEQTITLNLSETKELTFTFERTEFDLIPLLANIFGGEISVGHDKNYTDMWAPEEWIWNIYEEGNFKVQEHFGFFRAVGTSKGSAYIKYDGWNFCAGAWGYSDMTDCTYILYSSAQIYNSIHIWSKYLYSDYIAENLIPSQTGFDYWIIQSGFTGTVPNITVKAPGPLCKYILGYAGDIIILDAKTSWNQLSVGGLGVNYEASLYFYPFEPCKPLPPSYSREEEWPYEEGHLDYYKMSSVPYDFPESGI